MGCTLFFPAASCSRPASFSIFRASPLSCMLLIVPARPNFRRAVFLFRFLRRCSFLSVLFCVRRILFVFVPGGRVFSYPVGVFLDSSPVSVFARWFSRMGSLCLLLFLAFVMFMIGLRAYCISLACSLVYFSACLHACRIGWSRRRLACWLIFVVSGDFLLKFSSFFLGIVKLAYFFCGSPLFELCYPFWPCRVCFSFWVGLFAWVLFLVSSCSLAILPWHCWCAPVH